MPGLYLNTTSSRKPGRGSMKRRASEFKGKKIKDREPKGRRMG